jgi:UDP-N-acetylglucosamine acyltransferase
MSVHPTAIVHPAAKLGRGVVVGPYSMVGEHVEIGDHSVIGPHVVDHRAHHGSAATTASFSSASIGEQPQDKKYAGEPTRLEIGDRNTIREFCTFNCGTAQDAGVTRLGNDNWIMAYVHLAHDCQVGDKTIFANNAQLAGHVQVGDWAILGGFHRRASVRPHRSAQHHRRWGCILLQDLPPFVMAAGNPAEPRSINAEGLKRRGFSVAMPIAAIKRAYKTLYKAGMKLDEARAALEAESGGSA